MIHRDLLFQAYQINFNYYIDLMIKDESIKKPAKSIAFETFEYLKRISKSIDDLIEQNSILLHNKMMN